MSLSVSARPTVCLVLAVLVAAGCAGPQYAASSSRQSNADRPPADGATGGAQPEVQASTASAGSTSAGGDGGAAPDPQRKVERGGGDSSSSGGDEAESTDRKIIRNARLGVRVDEPQPAVDAIGDLADTYDGYVVRSSYSGITLRVDADRLEEALADIADLDVVEKVLDRSITSRDVTDQFKDYRIRLDNKRQARQRYLDLLEKAMSVEAMIEIENELERLNGEIERLEGQLRRMREQIALSKISVDFESSDSTVDYESGWEANFMPAVPGLAYSALSLGPGGSSTFLQGATLELLLFSWRDPSRSGGPSHIRLYTDLSLLKATGSGDLWGTWAIGGEVTFEGHHERRWLIPMFGLEGGEILRPTGPKAGHVTPTLGAYLWSGNNVSVALDGGYVIPPAALGTLRGWRGNLAVHVNFW